MGEYCTSDFIKYILGVILAAYREFEKLAPSVKKTSIGNSLKTLVEEGFIKRHGQGKNTFYTRKD